MGDVMEFCVLIIVIWGVIRFIRWSSYKKTEYYKQTGTPFYVVNRFGDHSDKGPVGEYLTYKYLKSIPGSRKFLFNVYVPKEDGTTSEIDVLMIHETGIYVFESKNYSGWIFGSEKNRTWTATLPQGKGRSKKVKFYNPIMQNKGHIKYLKSYLGNESIDYFSYIVFSERCELKKIELSPGGAETVIKRNELRMYVNARIKKFPQRLTSGTIEATYGRLYPLTQKTAEQKQAHVENIRKKYK